MNIRKRGPEQSDGGRGRLGQVPGGQASRGQHIAGTEVCEGEAGEETSAALLAGKFA